MRCLWDAHRTPGRKGEYGFCVSFVEATEPEAVLDKMVGGCGTGIVSVAEAREWATKQKGPDYGSVIEAGIANGWVVTVEENGYTATLPDVVGRISKGTRAIVVFRNIHDHASFLYAVDGIVVRSFDPVLYDDPTPWDGPPLPEESGLDVGSHPMASAFACAERLTRIRLTPALLDDHGDWIAIGHHPSHSLLGAGSWLGEGVNVERPVCEDDARRQFVPNRLLGGDDVVDASELFLCGWIGWVQFLLGVIAAAPLFVIRTGLADEYLNRLPPSESSLIVLACFALFLVVGGLTPMIGRMLERVAGVIERARNGTAAAPGKRRGSRSLVKRR
jgi:hypothetical protein